MSIASKKYGTTSKKYYILQIRFGDCDASSIEAKRISRLNPTLKRMPLPGRVTPETILEAIKTTYLFPEN